MKRIGQGLLFAGVVIGCAAAGFALTRNKELRMKLAVRAKTAVKDSKEKLEEMSEEVALRTARVTNNPKVVQNWVENQWESLGN